MSKPITKVELYKFRGASESFEVEFDPTKALTLIFGENGSGKSTIIDSIDVVCNENVGSIESISTGTRRTNFIPTIGSKPADVSVQLYSREELWTASIQSGRIGTTGDTAKPLVAVLRRDKIQDLVIAQPRARYEALRQFIDVDAVRDSEARLGSAIHDQADRLSQASNSRINFLSQIDGEWNEHGTTGANALDWASAIAEQDLTDMDEEKTLYRDIIGQIDGLYSALAESESSKQELEAAESKLEVVQNDITNHPELDAKQAIGLVNALSRAKNYIESTENLIECPVCGQAVNHDELLQMVTGELAEMQELKELNDRLIAAGQKVELKRAGYDRSLGVLKTAADKIKDTAVASSLSEIRALEVVWPEWGSPLVNDDIIALAGICEQFVAIGEVLDARADLLSKQVGLRSMLKRLLGGVADEQDKRSTAERILTGLRRAAEILRDQRIEYTQAILDSISEEADRLYQQIHPDESIGLSRLRMITDRNSSIEQEGNFHGHDDVPPQAFLSESHMDTLGFCVWLALVKKEQPENRIVIMDDIFTSVDSVHLTRIIDLLADECSNFLQVIATTHYRNWFNRYVGGQATGQNTELIQLGPWAIAKGISHIRPPLSVVELRELLVAPFPDRRAIASTAGILLERTLNQITEQYCCRVARNPRNEFTMSVLLNGSTKLFQNQLQVKVNANWEDEHAELVWNEVRLKDQHFRVKNTTFVRNQVGCHYNVDGMDIADRDVVGFGQLTLELVEPLICPKCGMIPRKRHPDGTGYRCQCNNLELRPLKA